MSLELTGRLIAKMPMQSGVSKSGNNWQKQEFVIETMDQYPKKICANLWGDKADQLQQFNLNDIVKISFDVESREFNGKWYTDVKAFRIEAAQGQAMPGAPAAYAAPASTPVSTPVDVLPNMPVVEDTFTDNAGDDDLPF